MTEEQPKVNLGVSSDKSNISHSLISDKGRSIYFRKKKLSRITEVDMK